MGRKIAFALSLITLLFTGVIGVYNGLTQWVEGETPLQHSVTVGVFLYGVFGLVTAYGLLRRRRWPLKTGIAWAIPIVYVPGVAVMVYGDDGAALGSAIAASAGSALIALGVLWTIKVSTEAAPRSDAQPGVAQ